MRRFIHTHAGSHRLQRDRDLTRQQRLDLHELEAQVCHRMSWELQVAESYRWHKLIAHRQKQTFEKHLQELKPNQILLWSDYKQNLTIPMAHTETGDMFYGTRRMEMTCWGCIIFRKLGGNLHIKHVIVLSSIIEHSTLVSNLLYKEATKQIEDFDSVTEIIAWSDCGPHYKSYDHCAGWTGDFVEAPPNRTVLLCVFGEKHGKGQVDGLFGEVEGWLGDFLKKKGSRIATVDEMEKVLHSCASRADNQTSRGQYAVVRWEPERKPIGQRVLPKPEFQISKTYCLQIHPGNPRLHICSTLMEDHTLADTYGQRPLKSFPKVEWERIADREWRRGYFFQYTVEPREAEKRRGWYHHEAVRWAQTPAHGSTQFGKCLDPHCKKTSQQTSEAQGKVAPHEEFGHSWRWIKHLDKFFQHLWQWIRGLNAVQACDLYISLCLYKYLFYLFLFSIHMTLERTKSLRDCHLWGRDWFAVDRRLYPSQAVVFWSTPIYIYICTSHA